MEIVQLTTLLAAFGYPCESISGPTSQGVTVRLRHTSGQELEVSCAGPGTTVESTLALALRDVESGHLAQYLH